MDYPIVIGPTPPPPPDVGQYAPVIWRAAGSQSIASASDINNASTSAEARQMTLAAENAPIRLIYGEARVGGLLLNVLGIGSQLYGDAYVILQVLWGLACEGVQSVTLNDQALPTGSTATHYDGSQTSADATLVAAFAAQSPAVTYADTLEGYCYSVLKIPAELVTGGLNVNAVVRGRKVYDQSKNSLTEAGFNGYVSPMSTSGTVTGITMAVIGNGVEADIPYIDVQVSGTAASDSYPAFYFNGSAPLRNAQTVSGNTWHGKAFAKIVSGSLGTDGYAFISHWGYAYPSGAYTEGLFLDYIVASTASLRSCEQGGSDTILSGSTAQIISGVSAYVKSGQTASAIIRVGLPRIWHSTGSDPYAYSTNPSLILADFLRSSTYGAGRTVDDTSLETAADANDATAIGEVHRRIDGWTLDGVTSVSSVVETLRTYAGVFLSRWGNTVYLIPDATGSSSATYAHASGHIADFSEFTKRDLGNAPTVVEVLYTDTSAVPYRDRQARAELSGVGTTRPRRVSTVRLNGITRHSQAYREAVRRLNELNGSDLSGSITIFDQGIAHEAGDIITLTLPIGITSKDFRVTQVANAGPGLWRLDLAEYEASSYSTEVQIEATYPDTQLPNPANPPTPVVVATEELFVTETGITATRGRLTITASTFIWLKHYEVEVWSGDTLVDSGTTQTGSYATPPLEEGVAYTCKARIVSSLGVAGTWGSDSFTAVGKQLVPGDVSAITGFEVGGDVYLSWDAAVDVDIWRYEIRWGASDATWETATLLDRIDGLRYISKGIVTPGVRKFLVKAIDSVGQYSTNAASCTVTVTLDPDSLQLEYYPDSPTLTGMQTYTERDGTIFDITSVGTSSFTSTLPNALDTYTLPLAAYWGGTSAWEGDSDDPWGATIAATWNVDSTHTDVGTGTSTLYLRLGTDGTNFTDYSGTGLPVKASARYARAKISSTNCFKVVRGGQRVYGNAVTRTEYGSVSVAGTGTTTVDLTGSYFARRNLLLTPVENGTASYYAVADNITLDPGTGANSFDVFMFDAAGNRVAGTADYRFEGI